MSPFSHIIAGGGLHGALIALALLDRDPDARVALIERAARLGGNHLWSFHAGDVPARMAPVVAPLVAHQWPRHEVRFPGFHRVVDTPYRSMTSERLHVVVSAAFARAQNARLLLGAEIARVDARAVTLADGTRLAGDAVLDARGAAAGDFARGAGFQKFVGRELAVTPSDVDARAGGLPAHPILMDATVDQHDGFRFVYVLPMRGRVLIEDTYFSDSPRLDRDALRARIGAYADALGLGGAECVREEAGVLPMPWRAAPEPPDDGVHRVGYRGGWFHPATAYSLPCGVRVADTVADVRAREIGPALRALRRHHDRQAGYARLLNAMLFQCFAPGARRNVFERFYRLPEPTISRFYRLELTLADRARIVVGRPPRGFQLTRALRRKDAPAR